MSKTQSWAQVVILSLMGLYFTYNLVSGNITNYIAQKFVWLSWVAAVMWLLMAAMRGLTLIRRQHDAHGHNRHSSGASVWVGLVIVALPVLFGVLVPSSPLDSRSLDAEISSELGSIEVSPGEFIGTAPQDRNVLDWLRAFSVERDLTIFSGQEAELVGFVYRDARFDRATQFMVARFVISCCVADAQAIGLVVEWPDAGTLNEDDWVRVRGTFEVKEFDGAPYPVLVAYGGDQGVQPTEQPKHPYLYP